MRNAKADGGFKALGSILDAVIIVELSFLDTVIK
jgi:hypothetical protein